MNIVKVKIHEYDEETKSLIVSFASDGTASQNPDDYSKLSYNLSLFDENDTIDDIKIKLAQSGLAIIRQQIQEEKSFKDPTKIDHLKTLVGSSFDIPVFMADKVTTEKYEVVI
jgi:hypothetical protein